MLCYGQCNSSCFFLSSSHHRNPWPWTELFDKVASHYELETVNHFEAVFASIDIDGGGTVDQEEIYEALLQAGVDISEEGVATLFNMIDEDGSGEIDKEEWKEAADFYLELKEEENERARMEKDKSKAQERLRSQKLAKLGVSTRVMMDAKNKDKIKTNRFMDPSSLHSIPESVSPPGSQAKIIRFADDRRNETAEELKASFSSGSGSDPLSF